MNVFCSVDLVFESVLQGGGEVCRVYSAVIVDVGSEPQQQVDQLVVAQTQRNLKDAKTGSDRQQGLSEEDQ